MSSSLFSLVRPSEVPSDLICAICMCLPVNPCALEPCEHIFCQECASLSVGRQPLCPIDRLPCGLHQIHPLRPNSFAHRIWSSVMVQCERCVWTGSIADFAEHQTKCAGNTRQNSGGMSSEKEREYLAQIDQLTWEVSLLSSNQRALESNNRQLATRNEELEMALEAKNHALRTTVDVLSTAISSASAAAEAASAEGADDNSPTNNQHKCNYDRNSILHLVQQMCQSLETRPIDISSTELFEFVRMIYQEMKHGGKHANNEHFRDDVKLILGIVGASSWFTRPQQAIIRSWCQEQGWGI